MDTAARLGNYSTGNRPITPRQRRRMIKNAGRDPLAIVVRDDGMGYGRPGKQGMRELVELLTAEQVRDAF